MHRRPLLRRPSLRRLNNPAATEAPAVEQPTEAAAMEEVALRWRTRPDNQEEADVYASISDELDCPA